jgi:hypothetical protein
MDAALQAGQTTVRIRDRDTKALHRRKWIAHGALAVIPLACAALTILPPASGFYPQCQIHEYLGLLCPGCGATRALAALLHGHLADALLLNALFVILLPFAIAGAALSYLRALRPGAFHWPQPPALALYATMAAAAIFTVARNLVR